MCEGRVAIVTGAAGSCMGRSIALPLAREGAKVVVNYRRSENAAKSIVSHIESRAGSAIKVQADVFEAGGCRKLVDVTVDEFGQVDICVIGPGAGWHPEPVDKLDSSAALDDIHQEVAPIYHLMPLILPGMYERRWGRVIAIALAQPHCSPSYSYDVGKAARVYALQHARDAVWSNRVTLNLIGPGAVPEIKSLIEAVEQCDHGPAWRNRTTTTPQDIAEGVTFLCSEAGRFVSGSVRTYMMA